MENVTCYAPIIIPTLNRVKHLKKCVDSLKKCELADKTELYISVDFPPSEKYVEGHKKVLNYLDQGICGFKQVHIIKHDHNIGPGKHSLYLQDLVFKKFDRYIFTEDDNVFQPSFLRFMNENLEKYKNDNMVTSICGYCLPINWSPNSNDVIRNNLFFSGWGYGLTKQMYDDRKNYSWKTIFDYLHSFKNASYLYKQSKHVFNNAVYIASRKHYLAFFENYQLRYMDYVMSVIQAISGKVQITPTLSKLYNNGYDGTGANCESTSNNKFSPLQLDSRPYYNIAYQSELELNDYHVKSINNLFPVKMSTLLKTWLIWLFFIRFSR